MAAEALTLTAHATQFVKTNNPFRTGTKPRRPFGDDGLCDRCRSDEPHIGFVIDGEDAKFVSKEAVVEIALRVKGCSAGTPSTVESYTKNTARGRANLFYAKNPSAPNKIDSCKVHLWALKKAGTNVSRNERYLAAYDRKREMASRCTPEAIEKLIVDIEREERRADELAIQIRLGHASEEECIVELDRRLKQFEATVERWAQEGFFNRETETFATGRRDTPHGRGRDRQTPQATR